MECKSRGMNETAKLFFKVFFQQCKFIVFEGLFLSTYLALWLCLTLKYQQLFEL
jgi:hypothetical protein